VRLLGWAGSQGRWRVQLDRSRLALLGVRPASLLALGWEWSSAVLVVGLKVSKGDTVEKGQPLCVMSAMKMETTVTAPITGVVERLGVGAGDSIQVGDLLVYIKGGPDFIGATLDAS